MKKYLDLLKQVRTQGIRLPNRTGIDTLFMPGACLQYDMREEFPAVTTKKLFFKGVKGEAWGFLRGLDNSEDFKALGCNVWEENANGAGQPDSPNLWLTNPHRKGHGDIGRAYGKQWTDWAKYTQIPGTDTYLRTSINQVEEALHALRFAPMSRRIIINGWRPDEFDQMALPPCHVLYHFLPDTANNTLHLSMFQRSCDMFLGVPFNVASCSLLLHLFAKATGFKPGIFTHFMSDVHIYVNHLNQVDLQLSRTPFDLPQLLLSDNIHLIETPDQVKNYFYTNHPDDATLTNYQSHPAIPAPMAI